MHYVESTRKEDKEREENINMLVNKEVEDQYARRDEKKEREKEARKALLQNVLQTRKQQIRERGMFDVDRQMQCPLNRSTNRAVH